MDLSRVYFHALLKDELIYEVHIRAEVPEQTVVALKSQLKKLSNEFLPEEIISSDFTFSDEFPIIKNKLSDLESKTNEFQTCGNKNLLSRARALYCHLFHRIERVQIELADSQGKSDLKNQLLCYEGTLSNVTNTQSKVTSENTLSGVDNCQVVTSSTNFDLNKWNVKFNGRGNPHSFLERVEELASAYGMSTSKLFSSAVCLFVDEGLTWYRGIKSQVTTWEELHDLLINEFQAVDYEYRLLGEIRSRTQGKEEPVHIYFSVMSCLFSRLKKKLSEEEKLEILMHNIRPNFMQQLSLVNISSVNELKAVLRRFEDAKQMADLFHEPSRLILNPEFSYKNPPLRSVFSVTPADTKRFCERCKSDGHSLNNCKADKRIKCFECGLIGYTKRSCPKCSGKMPVGSKN
jgi:hypothetical protein